MEIEIKNEGVVSTLSLRGRLDTTTAGNLENALKNVFPTAQTVVLNCTDLSYVSSAGLRVFLTAQKTMTAKGGALVLRHVCENVKDVLQITGFADILTLED